RLPLPIVRWLFGCPPILSSPTTRPKHFTGCAKPFTRAMKTIPGSLKIPFGRTCVIIRIFRIYLLIWNGFINRTVSAGRNSWTIFGRNDLIWKTYYLKYHFLKNQPIQFNGGSIPAPREELHPKGEFCKRL